MNKDGIKFTSALGNTEKDAKQTDVLIVDKNGATVTGKLVVKDKGDKDNEIKPRIIFEADPFGKQASGEEKEIKPHVLIGSLLSVTFAARF